MYGLVNQAIKDLVTREFGEEKWKEICSKVGIPSSNFVSMDTYPDAITYGLVGAASQCLNMPAETILTEFGKFWITFTADEGYGPLMDLFGSDFRSCLKNLNNLHARMGMTMPQLTPPRFKFIEVSEKIFHIHYISQRQGLGPMVKGLLEGLAIKYGEIASVEQIKNSENSSEGQIFRISLREEV